MLVNSKQLKEDLDIYNELLKEYEEIYLNYYNTISSFSFFWNDEHSKKFYNSILKEKMHYRNILDELNCIKEIYKYIYLKYSQLGKKIYIELKSEDYILSKFNEYINKINNVIYIFNNLNLNFCPDEAKLIIKQKQKLIKCKKQMEENKEEVKKYFSTVRDIEQTVRYKLKNMDISYIKETNIKEMI